MTYKTARPSLVYICIAISILTLGVLFASVFIAREKHAPIDTSAETFEEEVATGDGSSLRLVHPASPTKGILFFIVDGLTPDDTTDYARQFAALSYNVVVLDTHALLATGLNNPAQCLDVGDSLQKIQDSLREKLKLDATVLPVLVGMNEGAAAVYSTLAQSNNHRFHAALSVNFSRQLNSRATLCGADKFATVGTDGVLTLLPVAHLSSNWFLFQDRSKTPSPGIRRFANDIDNAQFTTHRSRERITEEMLQVLQWLDPHLPDQLPSENTEGHLPLIEVTSAIDHPSQALAILLTGDGGWATIDRHVAAALAKKGIPTVALDSLNYFWKKRTPEEVARVIENTMTEFMGKWQKKRVILIGYSFGADVLPFIANRIHADRRDSIALVALLGIGKSATFEFHLSNWMGIDKGDKLPVQPEIERMHWAKSICIYGVADKEADCEALGDLGVRVIGMNGDHHFAEKYDDLVQRIVDNID